MRTTREADPPFEPNKVSDWVFDLDNTLYPRRCNLFGQMDLRMTSYVAQLTGLPKAEARILQKRLYRDYGTTLNGLMLEYDIDPHHYLADVHDIDYSVIAPDPLLRLALHRLPGRKHVFTNGNMAHAERTLMALGIAASDFDSIFDIVAADFEPKPRRGCYERFVTSSRVDASRAVMFEDLPRNLEVAKEMGMTTVLIVSQGEGEHGGEAWEREGDGDAHVDHVAEDIAGFLTGLLPDGRHPGGAAGR